jgi:tetratricopeptide (TPR) repeat protein
MNKYVRYFFLLLLLVVIIEGMFFLHRWLDGFEFQYQDGISLIALWAAVLTSVFLVFAVMGLWAIDGRIKELSDIRTSLFEVDRQMKDELSLLKIQSRDERNKIVKQAEKEVANLISLSATRQNLYDRLSRIAITLAPDQRALLYTEFLQEHPNAEGINFAFVHICRGDAYLEMGLNEEALRDYEEARRLAPDNESPYLSLGNYYVHQKNYTKSVELFKKAIELKPTQASLYMNVGNSYAMMGQYEKSKEFFDKAKDINPNIADIYYNEAKYTMDANKKDGMPISEILYKHCLKLNPIFYRARLNLAGIMRERSQDELALEEYNHVLTDGTNEDIVMAYIQRGICYWLTGNPAAGLLNFQHAYLLAPHNIQNLYNLAASHFALYHLIEADQFLKMGREEAEKQDEHSYDQDFNCLQEKLNYFHSSPVRTAVKIRPDDTPTVPDSDKR